MITYNHERFIAQAVESVLMQQTNFPYELIIGEDCSTDNTREMVREYQRRHPDKIRLLLPERNLGGPIPGKRNYVQTLNAATGKYIALLEGDDYWTSPHKLQKQVDFLDSHPSCAVCFTNAVSIFDKSDRQPEPFCPPHQKPVFTLDDILASNPMLAATVLFRRGLFGELPPWFHHVMTGDWALHILNTQHGDAGYLPESTAAYRVHAGGVWSMKSVAWSLGETIKMLKLADQHLGFKHHAAVQAGIANCQADLCLHLYHDAMRAQHAGDLRAARRITRRILAHQPHGQPTAARHHAAPHLNRRHLIKKSLWYGAPGVLNAASRLKRKLVSLVAMKGERS